MNRRTLLRRTGAATATGAMSTVAGCGILGGCGPGETEIGTLAERAKGTDEEETTESGTETERDEPPRVEGSIESVEQNEIVIDDGTGRASLQTLGGGGFRTRNIGDGDCAYAKGFPTEPESSTAADVVIYVTEIGLADEE